MHSLFNITEECTGDPTDDCNNSLTKSYEARWFFESTPELSSSPTIFPTRQCTEFLFDLSCPKKPNSFETKYDCEDACVYVGEESKQLDDS